MTPYKSISYRFDEFQVDLARRRLLRDGVVIALKPRVFDLLAVLVENNGELLAKDDLFRLVWGDQFVEETNLTVSISAIRRALGETASEPRYITNVSGRGYYFNAELLNGDNAGVSLDEIPPFIKQNGKNAEFGSSAKTDDKPQPYAYRAIIFVAAALLASAASLYFVFFRGAQPSFPSFQALSVSRLTTTGRAQTAAISSDGRMFVFTQLEPDGKQSLWLSQTDGGGQIQLRPPSDRPLSSIGFAPDGNRIYYVQFESNRTTRGILYRLPVIGGVPEKIREDVSNRLALSPDGKQIAFLGSDEVNSRTSVIIAGMDGSVGREAATLTADLGTFTSAISWSPSGEYIAVAAFTSEKVPGPIEIFVLGVADGKLRQITNLGWNSATSIAWTKGSDGLIAAGSVGTSDPEKQIWHISFPSSEAERLLADSNGYGFLDIPSDNSAILAIQTQSLSNVWVAPANDLSKGKQITFDMIGKQSGWNGIDWTNDGKIIFSARLGKSDTLWEMSADGTEQRHIFPEEGRSEYPSLPDDGSFIVFTSNRSGGMEIWRTSRDGSDLRQLTRGGNNEDPHVSPNGRFVVYRKGRSSDGRLWRVSAEGGESIRLTDKPSDWARFSPDSKVIGCAYEVDGKPKLAVIGADGGEPLKLFDVPASVNFRLGVRWTPDGKSVTYRDWQNGIWKQDLNSDPPTRLNGLPAEKFFAYSWSRDGRWFAYSRGTAINDVVLLSSLK